MIRNYFTLRALVGEAVPVFEGAVITEIYSQEKDELVLAFGRDLPGLILSCRPETSVFYIHPAMARAKRNAADIFPGVEGQKLVHLSIHPSDRIVSFSLEDGRELAGLFFGTAANVLLLGTDRRIEHAFRNDRDLHGTAFQPREEEVVYDLERLESLARDYAGAPAIAALRKLFPPLGSTLVLEALFRAGIPAATPVQSLTAERISALTTVLQSLLVEVQHPLPRVYEDEDGRPSLFSIVPLRHASDHTERTFVSVHEGVRHFVARQRATGALTQRKHSLVSHIHQHVEKAQRAMEAVQSDAGDAARASEYERYGSLLMAHLGSFSKGDREVLIPDDSAPVRVALDPRLTPVQNAQRYFEKAKRARGAALQNAERMQELEERVRLGTSLLASLDTASTMEELKRMMTDRSDELREFGIGEKGNTDPLPFRRFVVDGGFEVWAGKSSENNDELTLHHAKPNDLWFHARGSSGSHVVLRVATGKGEPGKKAREQAAAIAAYYSKMKTAGLVPVAMTEKRYVRKPKGAKPGSVVLEREKVIFVKPGLPDDGSPFTVHSSQRKK